MSDKLQCHYKLMINWVDENGNPKQEIVKDPITIEFNVVKTTQSENSSRITIYNLDGATRESIYQDRLLLDTNPYIKWVTLEAGYGEQLTLVTFGYIQECHSFRSGVDFVTIMDVTDPDILTEYCGVTFEAGTTFKQAYEYLIGRLPSLKLGETGVLEGAFQVPTVFDGNVFVLANKLTGGHTFVDNGVVHNLNDNETLSDYGCYYIAADTGLLDTPKRYDHILEISMLFEPTIKVGQLVEIKSSTQARFDGQYKTLSVNHNCLISGAEGGTRITTLQLQYIEDIANSNENLTDNPAGAPSSVVKNNDVQPIGIKISSSIESIYKYIKKTAGGIPDKFINSSISWKNMIGNNNTASERLKDLTTAKLQSCTEIANRVVKFRDTYFAGKKLTITSGWRSVENNKREGGVSNSQHLTGRAVDFKISGVSASEVASKAKKSGMFAYVKGYSTWTHADIRKG